MPRYESIRLTATKGMLVNMDWATFEAIIMDMYFQGSMEVKESQALSYVITPELKINWGITPT